MDGPHEHVAEPESLVAELLNPVAERLPAGTACIGCGYDLVGRVPGEPCPECGLDVAASWPVQDLRRCHPVYLEHVRKELGALHGVAVMVILCCSALGVATGLLGWPWGRASGEMVLIGSLMVAVILGGGVPGQLIQFFKHARGHPRAPLAMGGRRRRTIVEAGYIVIGGYASLVTLAIFATALSAALGLIIALMSVGVAGVAMLAVYMNGLAYARETLERAGVAAKPTLVEGAPGRRPLAILLVVAIAVLGLTPHWWALTVAALGVAMVAGGLALRCARTRRVLEGLIAEAE
ncbi:MAG: hypothetical protein ACIAQU_07545 [Phycisphaerales bacterium JB064]